MSSNMQAILGYRIISYSWQTRLAQWMTYPLALPKTTRSFEKNSSKEGPSTRDCENLVLDVDVDVVEVAAVANVLRYALQQGWADARVQKFRRDMSA